MYKLRKQQGFALITVLIIGAVLAALLSAYFVTTLTEISTTSAASNSVTGFYAAEAGLNMRAEEIRKTFQNYSRPSASDLGAKSYTLSNGRKVTTSGESLPTDPTFSVINAPDDPFNGLISVNSLYTVSSVAKNTADDTEAQLDMQITMREIPVFQFLGFHQENMEFHPGPPMTIHGRIHSNKGMYLSANSGLTIDGLVTGVTDIRHGTANPNDCPSGPVNIMAADGNYKRFTGCKKMTANDLEAFGGRVKYLDEPLALPSPESFEWKTGAGFYWQRAELRIVLNQDRYVDLFAAAGRAGDKPRFEVPAVSNGNCGNGNGNGNGCNNGNGRGNNGNGNGNCGNGNGNGNGCNNTAVSIPVTIWAPEIQVYNVTGTVDAAATKKLYSLMIDNPGMITVNLPRNGRTNNGRPSANSTYSPEDNGPNNNSNATNRVLSTSYAIANNDPLKPLIPSYCQTYTDLSRPWNANANGNANYNHQDVRGKNYLYPDGSSIDNQPTSSFAPTPAAGYAYFTNPNRSGNLNDICEHVVARGEFYHYRQNREMFMLNVNLRQFLEANRTASSSARLFDPTISGPNGGLVLYLSVDGLNHTPAAGKGNNYGVRLFDGADLSVTKGMTVVTDQAAYVQGDFNCRALATNTQLTALTAGRVDTGNLNTSSNPNPGNPNPVSNLQPNSQRCDPRVSDASGNPLRDDQIAEAGLKRGVAVMADSINILSDAWQDFNSRAVLSGRLPSMTQQNFAILAGSNRNGEGGLHNFPRFLENWGYISGSNAVRYRYRGSLAAFGFPKRVDGVFDRNVNPSNGNNYNGSCCDINYQPPTRDWDFDLDFTDAQKLPPLTPRAVSLKQDLFLRNFEQQ